MKADNTKISVLPNGLDLAAQDLAGPSFDEVKRIISKIHYRIPYVKLISWDIALNEENVPTFIECNFAGMIQIHEAVTGPLFGDLMPELLDEYLLKEFFVRIAEKDFICKEFHDHITLIEYIGESENVVIPDEINGKPVTKIDKKAFKGCTISNFTAPLRLMKQANAALADHIKE